MKQAATLSIVFDGGTSVTNYVFGPSFDCGNSAENVATDSMSRRESSVSVFDEISEGTESFIGGSFAGGSFLNGSCPENSFIFDGGNSRSNYGSLEY